MPLLVKEAVKLNQLANSFVNYRARMYGYYAVTAVALQKATKLIELIKRNTVWMTPNNLHALHCIALCK